MAGFWSPERLQEARDLAAAGMTARAIGDYFGVSKNSVIGANFRHGVGLLLTPTGKGDVRATAQPI